MIINLRDFYPYYTCDALVEVSDEIGAVLLESKREEKNYWNRLGYHKAYYSLDPVSYTHLDVYKRQS